MQNDMNYKMGALETGMKDMQEDISSIMTKMTSLEKDVSEIKNQLQGWTNRAAGAVGVLSIVGAALLWAGDGIIALIKTKLGF